MKTYLLFFVGLIGWGSFSFASDNHKFNEEFELAQDEKRNVKDILDELADVYNVHFVYDDNQVSGLKITFESTQKSIESDLSNICSAAPLTYKKMGASTFVIKRSEQQKIAHSKSNNIQSKVRNVSLPVDRTISGTVIDADNGEPLISVNILEKGTGNGAVSDFNGQYNITVKENATLLFSYIGFQNREVNIGSQSIIDVKLNPDAALIDEVVVVGYGSQKRSDLTGALDRISEQELKQLPNTGLEQALQGRSAGVYVTQNSGAPGGAMSIRIRGTSSTLSAEPLYVVDGIPIINDNAGTSATFERDGGGQYTNALTTINPNDIESIEILKDASATAIYGARAANGVVLITTKKGKEGRSNISYDTYFGVQQLYRKIPVMNLRQYASYVQETGQGDVEEFENLELLGQGTDWQDEVFRTAGMYNHQLSFTGGDAKTKFSLSGGLHQKNGIVRGSDFQRYSLKVNVDHSFSDVFRFGGNIMAARTKENITFNDNSNGVIYTALLTPPMVAARNLDGTFGAPREGVILTFDNPLANALTTDDVNRKSRALASIYGEADITPWMKYRAELGTDILYTNHNTFWPSFDRGTQSRRSKVRRNNNNSFFWLNKHLLTFNFNIRDKHRITTLLGFEAQEGRYEWLSASRENLPTNDLKELNLGDAGTQVVNGGAGHWALVSYFGRLNYALNDKYLLTGTLRTDGSSRFGANNRYGWFPSAALAWRASNEKLFSDMKELSNLKFRVGYGSVGNQEIGLYSFVSNLRSVDVAVGDQLITGFAPQNISNPDVKWESSLQINLGMDLGLFNNRLEIIIDAYNKISKDMLLPAILPATAGGLQAPFINIGEMNNKGVELTLNTQNITGKFNWKTSANFSVNRNEVVDLGSTGALTGIIQRIPLTRTEEDMPIGQFFGHKTDGIFGSLAEIAEAPFQEVGTRPGDIRFQDLNNDGTIDDEDRTFIGSPHPDFTLNFINDISWKNFDLNIFFRGVFGNEVYNILRRDLAGTGAWHNQSVDIVDRWTADNPDGNEPRSNGNDPNQNRRVSDRFVEDGSYIRLQNVTLGYNMPATTVQKFGMQSFRLYVSGQNIFTATKYSGYDPEVGSFNQNPLLSGLDNGRFPVARSFTMGLNINF